MRRLQVVIVSVLAGVFTLGIPSHVLARTIPDALDHRITIADTISPGETVRERVVLPWRANLVGVSFLGTDPTAEGVSIEMRARDGGTWGDWVELEVDDDEMPDAPERRAAGPRTATVPQWVDAAKHLDVRLALSGDAAPLTAVRVETINTVGDAHDRPLVLRALSVVGRFLTATTPAAAPAEARPNQPSIITRRQWGADESWRDSPPRYADHLVMSHVHHTVNSNSYSKSESAALVRGIYRYHTKTQGFSDIGYNFLIDRYGQIFEGRYGGITRTVIGAHAGGFNTGSTGISLIGTFDSTAPPSATVSSLKKLLAWKLDVHHVPPVGKVLRVSGGSTKYPEGKRVWVNRISGHRDTSATGCPGTRTYYMLPDIRKAVEALGDPKIYLPEIPENGIDLAGADRNAPFELPVTFSVGVRWWFTVTDAGGDVMYSRTGKGTSATMRWDGLAPDRHLVPSGTYRWKVAARSSWGRYARAATGSLWVDAAFDPPFYDDDDTSYERYIDAIEAEGITTGCAPDTYCIFRTMTRKEAAVFVARAMSLPPALADYFDDDDGSPYEPYINQIAEAGFTPGCGEDRFCPDRKMTRAMMAAFLARGLGLPNATRDYFDDDDGSRYEPFINKIAEADISPGCGGGNYCPGSSLHRGSGAAFIARAFNLV